MLEFEEMNIEVDKEINILMNEETNIEVDINEADPFTLMMIQNRSIAIQNNILRMKESVKNNLMRMKQAVQNIMKQSRINIRSMREDILLHQLTINTLKENKTKAGWGSGEHCYRTEEET